VLNAGGTGGGIRKDVKIIKSKNAVKLGVWSGDSSKSPRKQQDGGLSEIGNFEVQQFNPKKFTDHVESQVDSIE
jgi:hypothetical protein